MNKTAGRFNLISLTQGYQHDKCHDTQQEPTAPQYGSLFSSKIETHSCETLRAAKQKKYMKSEKTLVKINDLV